MPLKSPIGSGKTLMALKIWYELRLKEDPEPTVILARTNAQITWMVHIDRYFDEGLWMRVHGNSTQRMNIWKARRSYAFLIMTYEAYRNDVKLGIVPKGLNYILDEPHRYLKDHRKTTFKSIYDSTWDSEVIIPVSGTFIKRGPEDLYSMLLLCHRREKHFASYWRYVNTWNYVIDGSFGKEIIGPKNIQNYKEEVLGKWTGWVTNDEAAAYMPRGSRIRVPLEPSDEQRTLLAQCYDDAFLERTGGEITLLPSALTRITRARQVLCCPKIIHENYGYGAALEEFGNRLLEMEEQRPVIYTPFTESIPYIQRYLAEQGRETFTFQGGLDAEELKGRIDAFQVSISAVGICSVSYAESFEFLRSSIGYFLGYSWSWVDNEQAEGRMTRLTSENRNPKFFYPIHRGYIDEKMFEVLNDDASRTKKVSPQTLAEMYRSLRQ